MGQAYFKLLLQEAKVLEASTRPQAQAMLQDHAAVDFAGLPPYWKNYHADHVFDMARRLTRSFQDFETRLERQATISKLPQRTGGCSAAAPCSSTGGICTCTCGTSVPMDIVVVLPSELMQHITPSELTELAQSKMWMAFQQFLQKGHLFEPEP